MVCLWNSILLLTAGPTNPWAGVHAELEHNSFFQRETTHTINGSHTAAEKKKGRKNSLDHFF